MAYRPLPPIMPISAVCKFPAPLSIARVFEPDQPKYTVHTEGVAVGFWDALSLLKDTLSLLKDTVSLLRDTVSLLRDTLSLLRDALSLLR
jgi:hypothetical protein